MDSLNQEQVRRAKAELAATRAGPWHQPGRWSISPHNYADDLRQHTAGLSGRQARISELTPRLLDQMPGVFATADEKIRLVELLADMGVHEAQIGLNAHKPGLLEHVKAIAARNIPIDLYVEVWTYEHAAILADAGVNAIGLMRVGQPRILELATGQPALSLEEQVYEATATLAAIKKLGVRTRAGLNDIGAAPLQYIRSYCAAVSEIGVDEISVNDSSSSLGPQALAELVREVRTSAPATEVAVHLHNDFGLAMTNALAALEAGASAFDTSVDGIGEKGGQLNLGTFVLSTEAFYQVETGISLGRLQELSRVVQELTGTRVASYFPLTGDHAFSATLEHHRRLQIEVDPFIWASIDPGVVGGAKRVLLGAHSGTYLLQLEARRLGFSLEAEELEDARIILMRWFSENRRPIADDELASIFSQSN